MLWYPQDLNSDGYADVAVGHALADPTSNSAGSTFIVLGGPAISSPLNLATGLDGTTGFVIQGSASGDKSGTSIANAGVGASVFFHNSDAMFIFPSSLEAS